MKDYPAIEIESAGDLDLILAIVDDFSPRAIEERGDRLRAFFADAAARDAARDALAARCPVEAIDVPDEDWARRSQEHLAPVTVGSVTVVSSARHRSRAAPVRPHDHGSRPLVIAIQPSMGFGTGHHATTRLCLAALQAVDLKDKSVLDVGTGSGILAIAAARLGAGRAVGIDADADAIQAARENLSINPEARHVWFAVADLLSLLPRGAPLPLAGAVPATSARRVAGRHGRRRLTRRFDVVLANLTGALLVRSAAVLRQLVRGGGALVAGGLQTHERRLVCRAFEAPVVWEREEDGWLGLMLNVQCAIPSEAAPQTAEKNASAPAPPR